MNIYERSQISYDKTGAEKKKIWDNINKLRGKITDKEEKVVLYTDKNEHILNAQETDYEMERYWTHIYRKYQNEIDNVWKKKEQVFTKN